MAKKKNLGGRPTKYNDKFHPLLVKAAAWSGMTDKEISEYIGISEATLNNWKAKYPKFLESLNEGKNDPNGRVKNALFQRAIGYDCDEDKIFNNNGEALVVPTKKHYPPDPTSMIFWLKNRDKDNWRDKQHIEHEGLTITLGDGKENKPL